MCDRLIFSSASLCSASISCFVFLQMTSLDRWDRCLVSLTMTPCTFLRSSRPPRCPNSTRWPSRARQRNQRPPSMLSSLSPSNPLSLSLSVLSSLLLMFLSPALPWLLVTFSPIDLISFSRLVFSCLQICFCPYLLCPIRFFLFYLHLRSFFLFVLSIHRFISVQSKL